MLKQQLQADQVAAMKSGDKFTLGVIRYIISQLKYREIEKKSELTDDEVVQVLRKQIKELTEAIEGAKKANRSEIVEENEKQIAIIRKYMPPELTDSEIEAEILKIQDTHKLKIQENPKAIIGLAMGALRSKADPARIQAALRKLQLM
ncbi:MAG: GatB/YqeY domain-containing protein [Patescibacteria group bacterium]|nr:GatB/YqeY domain-containing protein [Patescibacteria group bacterium]